MPTEEQIAEIIADCLDTEEVRSHLILVVEREEILRSLISPEALRAYLELEEAMTDAYGEAFAALAERLGDKTE